LPVGTGHCLQVALDAVTDTRACVCLWAAYPAPPRQKITYQEFLPALLGHRLEQYWGYDDTVDPRIATEFATVGFRLEHTMMNDRVEFPDRFGISSIPPVSVNNQWYGAPALVNLGIGSSLK
jgi:hypothetical protein